MIIYEVYSFVAGLRCNEHDYPDVIAVRYGFHFLQIIIEGKIGDDYSIHISFLAIAEKLLVSHVVDGIEISHEYQRHLHTMPSGFLHLCEYLAESSTVSE